MMANFKSQKGIALVWVLGIAVVLTLLTAFVTTEVISNQKQFRKTRVKQMRDEVINATYAKLSMPVMYKCAPKQSVDNHGNFPNCGFDPNFFIGLDRTIPGAKCAAGVPNCGIKIDTSKTFIKVTSYDSYPPPAVPNAMIKKAEAHVSLIVDSIDSGLAPYEIAYEIPPEVLSASAGSCPSITPLMRGMRADGSADCVALPTPCAEGSFISGYNSSSNSFLCQPILAGGSLTPITKEESCPPGEILVHTEWINNRIKIQCAKTKNPCEIRNDLCP
jgi:hypothetical protein